MLIAKRIGTLCCGEVQLKNTFLFLHWACVFLCMHTVFDTLLTSRVCVNMVASQLCVCLNAEYWNRSSDSSAQMSPMGLGILGLTLPPVKHRCGDRQKYQLRVNKFQPELAKAMALRVTNSSFSSFIDLYFFTSWRMALFRSRSPANFDWSSSIM